jgi:hypothetical protein
LTAVSRVVCLCLMASHLEQRNHKWRRNAKKELEKYAVDYDSILRNIPESERELSPESSTYKGKDHKRFRTYSLRSCRPDQAHEVPDNEDEEPDASDKPTRPSKRDLKTSQKGGKKVKQSSNSKQSNSRGTQRQYCTQKCLLGMVKGLEVDESCANAPLHPRSGIYHAIDQRDFLRLIKDQLTEDLDHNFEPLGLQGARGALFQITLLSHGYVFVGKGTVQAFVPDLLHEGSIYQHLTALQGTAVPVYLGRILHLLLMSWGGPDADEVLKEDAMLQKEIQRTVAEVRGRGIDQDDERMANMLWNREVGRVMLIDFERAKFIGRRSQGSHTVQARALQERSPNKKRKMEEPLGGRIRSQALRV